MPKFILNPQTGEYEVQYEQPEEIKTGQPIIPYQDQLKVRKIYGGFPIYNTSTGVNVKYGEMYIISTLTQRRLCVKANQFSNTVSSIRLNME